jgi:hypothetical protein
LCIDDQELLSIDAGIAEVRIDLLGGSFLNGPVALAFNIHDCGRFDQQIQALTRFHRLNPSRAPKCSPDPLLDRLILELRALDALHENASLRDIGKVLFSRRVAAWGFDDSVRSATRRLVVSARRRRDHTYLRLL